MDLLARVSLHFGDCGFFNWNRREFSNSGAIGRAALKALRFGNRRDSVAVDGVGRAAAQSLEVDADRAFRDGACRLVVMCFDNTELQSVLVLKMVLCVVRVRVM